MSEPPAPLPVRNARAAPRSAAAVLVQLSDLSVVHEAAQAYGTPDFASQLGADSLARHEQDLREELRAAQVLEGKFDGELVVDGDAVNAEHGIEFSFLGKLLETTQSVFHSLAAAMAGSTSRHAKLPDRIISQHTLRFVANYPSSFAVQFKLDAPEAEKTLMELPPSGVLERFTALIDGEADQGAFLPFVQNARLKTHYLALNELLSKANTNLCIRTRACPWGRRLAANEARHRMTWLESIELTEQETTVHGLLVGGSVEYDRFELATGKDLITGRIALSARADLRQLRFGEEVTARVKQLTTRARSGSETSHDYLLLSVVPRSGEGQLFPDPS